jgi:hypothetical protein
MYAVEPQATQKKSDPCDSGLTTYRHETVRALSKEAMPADAADCGVVEISQRCISRWALGPPNRRVDLRTIFLPTGQKETLTYVAGTEVDRCILDGPDRDVSMHIPVLPVAARSIA